MSKAASGKIFFDESQVIEKCGEYNKPLYLTFIDYEKSFNLAEIPAVLIAQS